MSIWRKRTTAILVAGIVIVILAVAISFIATHFGTKLEVRMGSGVYYARVASTEDARVKGLSGVETLAPNDALLMVFDSDGKWGIWMKDMKVPLDIIWLNDQKKVVYIVKNASPDTGDSVTYKPNDSARYVLEVPAGTVQTSGIRVGHTVIFDEGGLR